MKKSTLTAIIMGIIGGVLAACGMVFAMVEQFNMFIPGIVIGVIGLVILVIIYPIYCAIEHKSMGNPNWKVVGATVYGVISALVLGAGMCLAMVLDHFTAGIIVSSLGLLMCLILIPIILKLTGHDVNITIGKIVSIIIGIVGFALVCVGVALSLPNIGGTLMIVGIVLGLVGVLVCALTPVIYLYKNKKF